jgi:hypothetical protein
VSLPAEQNGRVAEPSLWLRLGPALSAAVILIPLLVVQELVSDLLPFFGSLLTLPLWMFLYYLQGLLVGWFARRDPRTSARSAAGLMGLGALSAFWSGVVFSTVIALTSLALGTLLTVGAALIKIPIVLSGSLIDILLNFLFASLGAWIYARRQGQRLTGVSCLVGLTGLLGYCLVVGALAAVLALGGFNFLLPYVKQYLPFIH